MGSLFAIIKDRATLVVSIIALAAAFGAGFCLQGLIKDTEIAELRGDYAQKLGEAQEAKAVFEARARGAERRAATEIAEAHAKFVEDQQHERAITQRRIAGLAAGNERLRVAIDVVTRDASLSGPAACASGGDGQATATIARPVAARLAGRYADYNELVDQIGLCQKTIEAFQRMTTVNQ
jgi:hypothetical protein